MSRAGGGVSRRSFLRSVVPSIAVGGVIGGLIGYSVGAGRQAARVDREAGKPWVKAGFIYVGPVGDFGWTYSHDQGRRWADARLPNSESLYVESVPEAEVSPVIESLIAQGCNLIVGTSFGYMDPMADAAEKNPDVYFLHINGFRAGALGNAPENMSVADINTYQIYYLEGLAGGAVTKTGSVGVIAAHPVPVVIRLINAFVLGANYAYKKRTGRNIKAYVVWLFSWFDPGKTREAAVSLVETVKADVLSFVEDSPTTLQVAEEYTTQKGVRVWSFSHYSDMRQYGPNSHLTGHLVNWGYVYLDFYRMVATRTWRSLDVWARLGDYLASRWAKPPEESTLGLPEGAAYMAPLNPAVPAEWAYHIKLRYEEMKEGLFEPFSPEGNLGEPIRDRDGSIRVGKGERAGRSMLMNMDWLVEYVD